MLIDAVAIDDPVIYCEHKYLYYHLKADALPKDRLPIGKARIVRPGRDLSIVTYSAMVHEALAVAKQFSADGVEIEVVDLRSVKPLDTDTVLASVARTGRLLCVGESFPWGGATAEVIARVATEGFHLARRGAGAHQRQRHADPLSSESLERASPECEIDRGQGAPDSCAE